MRTTVDISGTNFEIWINLPGGKYYTNETVHSTFSFPYKDTDSKLFAEKINEFIKNAQFKEDFGVTVIEQQINWTLEEEIGYSSERCTQCAEIERKPQPWHIIKKFSIYTIKTTVAQQLSFLKDFFNVDIPICNETRPVQEGVSKLPCSPKSQGPHFNRQRSH